MPLRVCTFLSAVEGMEGHHRQPSGGGTKRSYPFNPASWRPNPRETVRTDDSSDEHHGTSATIAGTSGDLARATRELPMPSVSQITGLEQAKATLQHCHSRLLAGDIVSPPMSPRTDDTPQTPVGASTEREERFVRWLSQWEKAFSTFLSAAMSAMKDEEVSQCRVLKANHLNCVILASADAPDRTDRSPFAKEFKAITDLCGAVLMQQHQEPDRNPMPRMGRGMTVVDLLQGVADRCSERVTRERATRLLAQMAQKSPLVAPGTAPISPPRSAVELPTSPFTFRDPGLPQTPVSTRSGRSGHSRDDESSGDRSW